MATDADIMARVQAGEADCFGQLVLRYHDRLLRVAESKLADRGAAEDVVQEAFLAAYAARESYDPQFAFSTWLWTILLNLCRRKSRRRTSEDPRSPACLTDGLVVADDEAEPVLRLMRQEQCEQLQRLLAELPEPQADALRLRFFGGLKYEEIAVAMECSLSGAKRRVKTGLQTLSRRLTAQPHTLASPSRHPTEADR